MWTLILLIIVFIVGMKFNEYESQNKPTVRNIDIEKQYSYLFGRILEWYGKEYKLDVSKTENSVTYKLIQPYSVTQFTITVPPMNDCMKVHLKVDNRLEHSISRDLTWEFRLGGDQKAIYEVIREDFSREIQEARDRSADYF